MMQGIRRESLCGQYRRCSSGKQGIQKQRAVYRSVGFFMLVIGTAMKTRYLDHHDLQPNSNYTDALPSKIAREEFINEPQHRLFLRRLDESSTVASPCGSHENNEKSKFNLIYYGIGVLYMFFAIAIVCDEFFVPSLEEIASKNHFDLSMDVAGATLMAAGGSAPELFTSLIGTFQGSEVGFGTIVGSAVFNVLFVIGMCAIFSKDILTLTWWPLARDCTYYTIGLSTLALFCGYVSPGIIEIWEALVLFALYIGYVILMKYNESLWSKLKRKTDLGKVSDETDTAKVLGTGKVHTFRAGLLNLYMGKGSLLDRVGIAMVTQISGDVDSVFKRLDVSGDGFIDNSEFRDLVKSLGSVVDDLEITQAIDDLDDNKDGKIDLKEFTKWYIKSETRLKAELKGTFDHFDADKSGTIDGEELTKLMKALGTEVEEKDIQATLKEAHIDGPSDQISYEEFHSWYSQSKYWEERISKVDACTDDIVEPLWNHLKFPADSDIFNILRWLFLLPILTVLCVTVPDVRQPGNSKLCFFSFLLSILWIGAFTFFMVMWAEVIGNTIGIPMILMGMTILAAGTSVPDLLSSVIVARMGEGDMAVSSSIGSNIFDITVGLPVPWLLFHIYHGGERTITIGTEGMAISIVILLIMIICILVMIHLSGWKMTKSLGKGMFVLYFGYLAQAIIRQLPLTTCVS